MAVLPGTRAQVILTLATTDTFEAISGAAVELQEFDPAIGDFRSGETFTTGPGGQASGQLTLPLAPGTYRYRALFRGSPEFRQDRSPEVRITVAES